MIISDFFVHPFYEWDVEVLTPEGISLYNTYDEDPNAENFADFIWNYGDKKVSQCIPASTPTTSSMLLIMED